jgi:hypothetical protein
MNISPFSKHIFWSWKPDADLPDNLVIQQVIAYGEIADFRLLSQTYSLHEIDKAINKWKKRERYMKHICFLKQIFLYD